MLTSGHLLLFDVSHLLVFSVHVAGYYQVANEFERKIFFFLGLVEVGGGVWLCVHTGMLDLYKYC